MCGIVAATSNQNILKVILHGLKSLEYRGYDSSGLAIQNDGHLKVRKSSGKIINLENLIKESPIDGNCGIGHTRWATHGKATVVNAHPHVSGQSVAVVHNGIIENSICLRNELTLAGYHFASETDSEVIPHLVNYYMALGHGFSEASRIAINRLEGSFALAITCTYEPGRIIAAKYGSPLMIGEVDEGFYIASDFPALSAHTNRYYLLQEGDVAEITSNTCSFYDSENRQIHRSLTITNNSIKNISKGSYDHFMQKEIFDQPDAIRNTLAKYSIDGKANDSIFESDFNELLVDVENIHIVACGTSYHAGLVAKYWLESLSRIPCQVEVASEYRYRQPVVPRNSLFICISQSGETADTLSALRYAKHLNYLETIAICNVKNSSLDRESQRTLLTAAGTEVSVASTKALTAQLVILSLLTLKLIQIRNSEDENIPVLAREIMSLGNLVTSTLNLEPQIKEMANAIKDKRHALFLGRGAHYPVAMEGALKLKEISYIHAEAYAAGELKHGPLALVDESIPIIAVCPNDVLFEKLRSNIEEIKARNGQLFLFTNHTDLYTQESGAIKTVAFNSSGNFVSPIIFNILLQLLAYHTAVAVGNDVDQPRNLAKSVTVE